jgi:replicative DNA helicase
VLYDENTEKIVLAFLLKDVKYINISRSFLKPDFFSLENLKRIYKFAVNVFDKWHTVVDYEILSRTMERNNFTEETRTEFLLLFEEMKQMDIDESKFSFYIDILKDLKIKRDLSEVFSSYPPASIEAANGEALLLEVGRKIHEARIGSGLLHVDKNFVYDSEFSIARLNEYEDRKKNGDISGIPYGWRFLDELTGGHYRQQMTLVFSRSGVGKTRALHTFGFNASRSGARGLFVTIEMSKMEIGRMYDSRLCNLKLEDIRRGTLNPVEEDKWRGLMDMMSMNTDDNRGIYVVDMARGCTVQAIEEEIVMYERQYGKLDFVIVDYLLLMESENERLQRDERIGAMARDLKELARVRDVSMITAIQANRKAEEIKGEEINIQHISVSDLVAAHSDTIMYLFRTTNDLMNNTLQVNLVKSRNTANKTFPIFADFSRSFLGDQAPTSELMVHS